MHTAREGLNRIPTSCRSLFGSSFCSGLHSQSEQAIAAVGPQMMSGRGIQRALFFLIGLMPLRRTARRLPNRTEQVQQASKPGATRVSFCHRNAPLLVSLRWPGSFALPDSRLARSEAQHCTRRRAPRGTRGRCALGSRPLRSRPRMLNRPTSNRRTALRGSLSTGAVAPE